MSRNQLDAVSKYLADISKLVFAAAVLGFFIPIGVQPISLLTFSVGIFVTLVSFVFSVYLVS